MSTVLVTGGSGLLGSWVTRRLIEENHNVVTFSRHLDTMLLSDLKGKFTHVDGDILDLLSLVHAIKDHKVERVIHMAAAMPEPLEAFPYQTYKINVDGTLNALEAARITNMERMVFTSSKAVYAVAHGEYAQPTCKPADEEYPRIPRNVYGATKLFGENMAMHYQRHYGLDVLMTRFSSTYGPGKQGRWAARAFHCRIIESALLKKPLKIPEGGDSGIDMTYCKDCAQGVVRACFAEKTEHRVFNIATGKRETFRRLTEAAEKVLGPSRIEIGQGHAEIKGRSSNDMVLNIDRARKELHYSPEYDLEASVRDYVAMMEKLGVKPGISDSD